MTKFGNFAWWTSIQGLKKIALNVHVHANLCPELNLWLNRGDGCGSGRGGGLAGLLYRLLNFSPGIFKCGIILQLHHIISGDIEIFRGGSCCNHGKGDDILPWDALHFLISMFINSADLVCWGAISKYVSIDTVASLKYKSKSHDIRTLVIKCMQARSGHYYSCFNTCDSD